MDTDQLTAVLERIATALEAIGAAETHSVYKDMIKLEKKTKSEGLAQKWADEHPCPRCATKK
jgi:enamine deaminase RidA (YjgF/YER057c/UK114 family)